MASKSSCALARTPAPISSVRPMISGTERFAPVSPSASCNLESNIVRRRSSISLVRYAPCEPTICVTNCCGSLTWNEYVPKPCRSATPSPMPGLRTMIGCGVPHFLFANSLRETKYTSAGKGVRSLKALPIQSINSGTLAVVMVWRPGLNTSSALPSRKKTALWLSRTITCEPMRKSPMPCSGKRCTISSAISFGYSMTSKILAMCFSFSGITLAL